MARSAQIQQFLSGKSPVCALNRGSTQPPRLLFPGAFNPLHRGHRQMAQIAGELRGDPVEFEISIENVDKPALELDEVESRLQQFSDDSPLWLTRAPTFAAKSVQFPGATFVIGTDTLRRIVLPKYYEGDPAAVIAAVQTIIDNNCRLLVFGRLIEGTFQTLGDLALARQLKCICESVSESVFRADISSTQLRRELRRFEHDEDQSELDSDA